MSAVLGWRSLSYDPSKYFVMGTEIAAAYVPGTSSRFAVYETRGQPFDGHAGDVYYTVRDAYTVTDEAVREGARAKVVARFESADEAVIWAQAQT